MVSEVLLRGEENALPSFDIIRLLGIRSRRELCAQVARERNAGQLILSTRSGGGGYFLPSEGEQGKREIAAFVATLHSEAVSTFAALQSARRALGDISGQQSIEE